MSEQYDIAIIGGGILGLATAMTITKNHPNQKVVLVEKEDTLAKHQTGHNSGVIHAGLYYRPGSQKASFALMVREIWENFVMIIILNMI